MGAAVHDVHHGHGQEVGVGAVDVLVQVEPGGLSKSMSSGHLYAAMPPEIPSKIFLFFNIISLYLYYFRLLPFTFISSVKIHFPFFIR